LRGDDRLGPRYRREWKAALAVPAKNLKLPSYIVERKARKRRTDTSWPWEADLFF